MQQRTEFHPELIYVVEKEWYTPKYGVPYSTRHTKLVRGYNYKPAAEMYCKDMNVECGNCIRRSAQKMRYYILENTLHVRLKSDN